MPDVITAPAKRQRRGFRLISGDPAQKFLCTRCEKLKLVSEFRRRPVTTGFAATSHCRPCWQQWRREHRNTNSSVTQLTNSAENLQRKLRRHGLTEADYFLLLERQEGKCAICGGPPNGRGRFHIDHDHQTGIVRGLLCHCCNTALGLLKDDAVRLLRAADYVLSTSFLTLSHQGA